MRKYLLIGLALITVLGAGFAAYRWEFPRYEPDDRLKAALLAVQDPKSYVADVVTSTTLSDRLLVVDGTYRLDFEHGRFGSFSTSTITIPDEKGRPGVHSFSLDNISSGNKVFLRIDTQSPLLKKTIRVTKGWIAFDSHAIPQQYTNIAVSGPVLDNAALLSESGGYLELTGSPVERDFAGSAYRVYPFRLAKDAFDVRGGTLEPLIGRIGTGTVEVWLDSKDSLRMMVFTGDNYRSTTTLQSVNTPVVIEEPAASAE